MNGILWALVGTLVTFGVTSLGAFNVFFIKNSTSEKLGQLFFSLSSGIMLAASIWSLLLPAIDMLENAKWINALIVSAGFTCGIGFFIFADGIVEKKLEAYDTAEYYSLAGEVSLHEGIKDDLQSGRESNFNKSTLMLISALTIHNIPEGMSVGLAFALAAQHPAEPAFFTSAVCLTTGIAIQNYPEGAAVSLPLYSSGCSRRKAFAYGSLSAVVEPIAGVFTAVFVGITGRLLPFLLAFAGGTMVYVVIEELLPNCGFGSDSKKPFIWFTIGFLIMMFLDVSLGS